MPRLTPPLKVLPDSDPADFLPPRHLPPAQLRRKNCPTWSSANIDAIEARIAAADEHLRQARSRVEDPAVAIDAAALTEALAALQIAQTAHDAVFARWVELTEKMGG